jgi:hypothetical protein
MDAVEKENVALPEIEPGPSTFLEKITINSY